MPQKASGGHITNPQKGTWHSLQTLKIEMGKKWIENSKSFIDSGQMEYYFTNLDFPEIGGFPETSATFWDEVVWDHYNLTRLMSSSYLRPPQDVIIQIGPINNGVMGWKITRMPTRNICKHVRSFIYELSMLLTLILGSQRLFKNSNQFWIL